MFYAQNTQKINSKPYQLGPQMWQGRIPGNDSQQCLWSGCRQTSWDSQSRTPVAPGPCPCSRHQLGLCWGLVHLGHCLQISRHTKWTCQQTKWLSVIIINKVDCHCAKWTSELQSSHQEDFNHYTRSSLQINNTNHHTNKVPPTAIITPSLLQSSHQVDSSVQCYHCTEHISDYNWEAMVALFLLCCCCCCCCLYPKKTVVNKLHQNNNRL